MEDVYRLFSAWAAICAVKLVLLSGFSIALATFVLIPYFDRD